MSAVFTKEMKQTHTILAPMMLPIHFEILTELFESAGYHLELLDTTNQHVIDDGLTYVHNDICYPAMLVIGQMIDALKSGRYHPDRTALLLTQTGGGCRASNYIHLLRKALENAGFSQVPVISLNLSGMEKKSAFHFTKGMLFKGLFVVLYGDLMMWISNQCRPYELHPGDTKRVTDRWIAELKRQLHNGKFLRVKDNYRKILQDYAAIPRRKPDRVRVGIVGEIYMKYSPLGNNCLEETLIQEGAEPVVSGLMDFLLYCFSHQNTDQRLYGGKRKIVLAAVNWAVGYLIKRQNQMIQVIKEHGVFRAPVAFEQLYHMVDGYISHGAKMGEGWLLTAEMIEYVKSGVYNVVCTQPFGCLPNHIVAKGMIRKIKEEHPEANIVTLDYDPSATKVNQENRLRLMLANAKAAQVKS